MRGWPTDNASGTRRPSTRRPIHRRALGALALVLGLVAAACTPAAPPPIPVVNVSTGQGLLPAFDPAITDYVDRCDGTDPVQVSVNAPTNTTVSVAGQTARGGIFTTLVTQSVGQSFTIVVSSPSPSTYYVRCLPLDFPRWTVDKPGTPQASGYVVDATGGKYPAIFDTNGVPLWWATSPSPTLYADLLADGNFSWVTYPTGGAAQERGLDGSLVHAINNTTTDPADGHDLLKLANGNYVIVKNQTVTNVDLSATGIVTTPPGGDLSSVSVLDHVIEELDSSGAVVNSWDVMDPTSGIPVTAIDAPWAVSSTVKAPVYDIYHWNSIEPITEANGHPGFLLSFRHLDAVYNLDWTTKQIVWKLGGNAEAGRSLTVANDPVFAAGGSLRGQHDARMLSDGSITIYDDGTTTGSGATLFPGRAPRGVRYSIDLPTMTATLLESVSNSTVGPTSQCCGSARRLSGGNWVMGWGGSKSFSELTPSGVPVFTLAFDPKMTGLLYRALPIPAELWNPAALRAGMDGQYAASLALHTTEAPPKGPVDGRAP